MVVETRQNIQDAPIAELGQPEVLKELAVRLKNFHELLPGDIFKATVTDIQPSKVSIRFAGGGGLTARSLILPEARIGDDTLFAVKENAKGQIVLEMLKPNAAALKENIAREALISADLYPSNENINLVKTLMDKNLPIDAGSLQKAAYFRYSAANVPMDKILFLMKENFPMNAVNIELLEKILEPEGFAQKLTDTFSQISQLDPPILRQIINKFMPLVAEFAPEFADEVKSGSLSLRKAAEGIKRNLPLLLKDKISLNRITEYFNKLHKALAETENILATGGKNTEGLREGVSSLRGQLEFMEHINNFKEYIQIPLNINDNPANAELYVFKNPRKASADSGRISALIALDNEHIGRVESFIECFGKNINLQFRAIYPETLKMLSGNFKELSAALSDCGVNISRVTYKNIDEGFTVLDDIAPDGGAAERKRYSFDMRV